MKVKVDRKMVKNFNREKLTNFNRCRKKGYP